MIKKLTVEDVYKKANLSQLDFKTTDDILPLDSEVVQQKRAQDSIKFGLSMKKFGYNLFVSGGSTSKRRSYLLQVLKEHASKLPVPNDLCYVHNFEDETSPTLISLPAGLGRSFKESMEELEKFLLNDVKEVFKSHTYHKEEELFMQSFDDAYDDLLATYEGILNPLSYSIVQGNDGIFYPIPVKENGELISQEEYESLSEEQQEVYLISKKEVDLLMIDFMHQYQAVNKDKEIKTEKMDVELVENLITPLTDGILSKFEKFDPALIKYIKAVKSDILENISSLKGKEEAAQPNVIQIVSGGPVKPEDESLNKYRVNVVIDNSELSQAPVVLVDEFDPNTFFGSTEFDVEGNAVRTDHSLIRSGDLLKANGGFLLLDVEDLFKYHHLWEKFKSTIKNEEITITSRLYRDMVISNTMKPQGIPFDVKVVLIGDISWYYLLLEHDPEFVELFKIHAIFEESTQRNEETENEYIRFITKYIKENSLLPYDKEALESILEYSSRLADSQSELVLNYNQIQKLLDESDVWASMSGRDIVQREDVETAMEQQEYRSGYINERYNNYLKNEVYLINTSGYKVGEINALTVLDYGDFATGKPSRLTANTYVGEGGVISIDRNAKMTGRLHDKGVETVVGFLGKEFAQTHPLSLTANITFEQNYGGVDGDSATSTTLYAILSDMAGIPINQSIAVTGSMNQKGEVQAIGGVNEKTEGFFQACKLKGLTGTQGVMIPTSNVQNLMLSKEVRNAIAEGLFHVYAVDHVSDGIKLLTGESYESIKSRIMEKLERNRTLQKAKTPQ